MVEVLDLKEDAREELEKVCAEKGIKLIPLNLLNENYISFIKDKDVIMFSESLSPDRIHRFIIEEF